MNWEYNHIFALKACLKKEKEKMFLKKESHLDWFSTPTNVHFIINVLVS